LKIAKEHIPVEIYVASSTDTSNKQYLYLSIENGKEMAYTHSNAVCGVCKGIWDTLPSYRYK
jgi:hypothetical protein